MQVLQRSGFACAAALLLVGSLTAQGPTLDLTRTVDVPSGTVSVRFAVSGATPNSTVFLYYGAPLFPGLSGRWGTLFINPATLGLITSTPIDTSGNGSTSLSFPMSVPDFNVVLQGLVLGGGEPPAATDAIQMAQTNPPECDWGNALYHFPAQMYDVFIVGDPGAPIELYFYNEGVGGGVFVDSGVIQANGEVLIFGNWPMDEDDVIEIECNGVVILELSCT